MKLAFATLRASRYTWNVTARNHEDTLPLRGKSKPCSRLGNLSQRGHAVEMSDLLVLLFTYVRDYLMQTLFKSGSATIEYKVSRFTMITFGADCGLNRF